MCALHEHRARSPNALIDAGCDTMSAVLMIVLNGGVGLALLLGGLRHGEQFAFVLFPLYPVDI